LINPLLFGGQGEGSETMANTITMTQYVPPIDKLSGTGFVRNLAPIGVATLPDDLADAYKLVRGTSATYRYRIGGELVDGTEKPACLLKFYYLMQVTNDQIARLNADASLDIWPELSPVQVRCHDELSARLATEEEANLLKISNTTPVIVIQTVTTDGTNTLLIQESTFVGTSFAYDYDYKRP
jgi:hypothetical protein